MSPDWRQARTQGPRRADNWRQEGQGSPSATVRPQKVPAREVSLGKQAKRRKRKGSSPPALTVG